MTQINLLPWREEARKLNKIYFIIFMASFIISAFLLLFILHGILSSLIFHQKERVQFLESELTPINQHIEQLKAKQKKMKEIENQLAFLISLRNESMLAVLLLNDLIKMTPETITLDQVVREENNIILAGKVRSDLQVTLYMKNITQSKHYKNPVLIEINAIDNDPQARKSFKIMTEYHYDE